MRKFNYTLKDDQKTIEQIEHEYCRIIKLNLKRSNSYDDDILNQILLCSVDEMNDNTHERIMRTLKPLTYKLVKKIDILFDYFYGKDYSLLQPVISDFISRNLNFKICPYCGIDYVNSFKECLTYYSNFEDFILNATFNELKRLKGIGDNKANNILVDRSSLEGEKLLKKYKKLEKSFDQLKIKPKYYNHFTLDHIFPKSKYPLFQISLYNLIPVCYSCNSKFKGEFEMNPNLIPNSENYLLDRNLKFGLIEENNTLKIYCKVVDDQIKGNIIDYIKEFKIVGRYNEHINVIKSLKENSEKYNKQKIDEISRQTGISVSDLKKIIFGEELFNGDSDVQLYKLKSDISKELGILE